MSGWTRSDREMSAWGVVRTFKDEKRLNSGSEGESEG